MKTLSKDLQKEFPGIQGFSPDNLWRMRKFYLLFKDNKKLAPLVQEISWTKNIIIMEKCKDDLEREFYIRMTKKFGWSKVIGVNIIAWFGKGRDRVTTHQRHNGTEKGFPNFLPS